MKMEFQSIFLVFFFLAGNVLSDPIVTPGRIRELKNFTVFWPCFPDLPHFVIAKGKAQEQLGNFFRIEKTELITVLADITSEKQKGMDGTAVIYEVVATGEYDECFDYWKR